MGLLSDKVALKREFEKAGLRYDQDTMKAIEALKANPEKTDDLISKIQEININQFDVNKDGVFDKKELEKMIVAMVTKGVIEGVQEFGTIEAFPKPKEFFAIREAKEGELVETYVKDGTLETSRVAKAGEYVIARCNADGSLILNADGKPNEWIPDNAKNTYDLANGNDLGNGYTVVTKNPARRLFVQIPETMTIEAPWGGTMTLESGSVLRFDEGTGGVYGIATQEFLDTHDTAQMTKDMIVSYDVLVDTLQSSHGDISVLTEIMSVVDDVLDTDEAQMPEEKDSADSPIHTTDDRDEL